MKFSTEPALWIEVVRTGLVMAILFGLHLTDQQLAGIMVFLGALALVIVRQSVTPNAKVVSTTDGKVGNGTTTGLRTLAIGILAAGALLGAAKLARAEDRPLWDPSRFSAGPRAVVQLYDFDDGRARETGFVLGAAAAWNLTSRWDWNAAAERKLNAGETIPAHWRYSTGLHVLLPLSTDRQQFFLAAERAWYVNAGESSPGNWVVRLQWSFGAQDHSGRDWAFAIARARYDLPENGDASTGRKGFGFGIQPQLVGGK